jgi:hypothetical protein
MDVERGQLSAILELGRLLDDGGFDYWLFGGWAVDFHVGKVTRAHSDIDLAVWARDVDAIEKLLAFRGWSHAATTDEGGGAAYERDGIRTELTFLIEGDHGEVMLAFRHGTTVWSPQPFGDETRELRGAKARVIPLEVLRAGKAIPREDPEEARVDRADLQTLSSLGHPTPRP